MTVNEVIPFSLLFPCHLFLVALFSELRSSGMADGSRPSVTTINYPRRNFRQSDGKTRSSGYMHVVRAHTRAHIRVAHPGSSRSSCRRANALRIFRIFRGQLGRWLMRSSGTSPSDTAAEPPSNRDASCSALIRQIDSFLIATRCDWSFTTRACMVIY